MTVPFLARTVKLKRYKCAKCGAVHNELPYFITPYVRYETDIIMGVLEGLITCETLGFEDFPSELTMCRWLQKDGFVSFA